MTHFQSGQRIRVGNYRLKVPFHVVLKASRTKVKIRCLRSGREFFLPRARLEWTIARREEFLSC